MIIFTSLTQDDALNKNLSKPNVINNKPNHPHLQLVIPTSYALTGCSSANPKMTIVQSMTPYKKLKSLKIKM